MQGAGSWCDSLVAVPSMPGTPCAQFLHDLITRQDVYLNSGDAFSLKIGPEKACPIMSTRRLVSYQEEFTQTVIPRWQSTEEDNSTEKDGIEACRTLAVPKTPTPITYSGGEEYTKEMVRSAICAGLKEKEVKQRFEVHTCTTESITKEDIQRAFSLVGGNNTGSIFAVATQEGIWQIVVIRNYNKEVAAFVATTVQGHSSTTISNIFTELTKGQKYTKDGALAGERDGYISVYEYFPTLASYSGPSSGPVAVEYAVYLASEILQTRKERYQKRSICYRLCRKTVTRMMATVIGDPQVYREKHALWLTSAGRECKRQRVC